MRPQIPLAALAAVALLAAGCGRSGSAGNNTHSTAPAASGNFGSLKDVCHPGNATGSSAQGVTSSQIQVATFSDVGFTQNPELVNAAKVFTSWCNAAGGIDGRKLVADVRDTKLLESVQQMLGACSSDFAVVGGSAALDGMAVSTRLNCLMPSFPSQVVMPQNNGSSLQVYPQNYGVSYSPYAGYFHWLLQEQFPASAKSIGILVGDSPITKSLGAEEQETLTAEGATLTYSDLFPPSGLSDWTPYAQAIKSKGVKGLVFYGAYTDLAKLEQTLTTMNYKLDWIDANSNAYGAPFIQLAGNSLSFQHNFAAISGYFPIEQASSNPATQQVVDLFKKYSPGQQVSLPILQAFSSWLLFATAAETCGSDLTRRCVYEAALKETAWTGGGLQAPVNVAAPDSPVNCFNVEEATPSGWVAAPFKPNSGAYRCGAVVYKLKGDYPKPVTLKDVGKSMSQFH